MNTTQASPPKKDQQSYPVDRKAAKKDQPSPEEIKAAVAKIVLAELDTWPEEVLALIGEDHPNEESFVKGVPYVIGAYMHKARKALEAKTKKQIRDAELEAATQMSEPANKTATLRQEFNSWKDAQLEGLERERKRRIFEARLAINQELEHRRKELLEHDVPDALADAENKLAIIRTTFEANRDSIQDLHDQALDSIIAIDQAKDDWNSKSRKAARKGNGDGNSEQAKEQAG